ncbi:MAG: hypothetical protein ACR2O4_08135 [Hyphomicrobiaceae bacterium]
MLALLVVVVVFGFAAWESRAHALSLPLVPSSHSTSASQSPLIPVRLSAPEVVQPLAMGPLHDVPTFPVPTDLLDIDHVEQTGASDDMVPAPPRRATEFVMEDQIFWRYAGRKADQLPWFVAEQKKKHAEITGRPQFLMLAIVFAAMSALTMGLWRQLSGVTRNSRPRRRSVRRLQ